MRKFILSGLIVLNLQQAVVAEETTSGRSHAETIAHTRMKRDIYRAKLRAKSKQAWAEFYAMEAAMYQREIEYIRALTELQRAQNSPKQRAPHKSYTENKTFIPYKR
jgi:hypothetical protein